MRRRFDAFRSLVHFDELPDHVAWWPRKAAPSQGGMALLLALSTWIAPGIAWTVPLPGQAYEYHHLTQDTALSLLVQLEGDRWLLQGELAVGGLNAGEPAFTLVAARAGAFLIRAPFDLWLSAGAGLMSYSAKSTAECSNFGCDPYDGGGPAVVAGIGARVPGLPVRASIFVDIVVPLFNIEEHEYYDYVTSAHGLFAVGVRLYL